MGNRAVIAFGDQNPNNVGIYLHWNGGRESIEGFMRAAKELGVRDPSYDKPYCVARIAQIIGNFFGGTCSIGVDILNNLDCDNGDNGVFVVGPDFEIVSGRQSGLEKERHDAYTQGVYEQCMLKNGGISKKMAEALDGIIKNFDESVRTEETIDEFPALKACVEALKLYKDY